MPIIISLDVGTSKLCALAFSLSSMQTLLVHSKLNDTQIKGLPCVYDEQDPIRIRELCFELIEEILTDDRICRDKVTGVVVTGQMHGVLLVSDNLVC